MLKDELASEVAAVKPATSVGDSADSDIPVARRGLNRFTVLVLVTASCFGLAFGTDMGTAAVTSNNYFRSTVNLPPLGDEDQETLEKLSLFTIVFHVGCLIGSPFAGKIADRFGRKPVMIAASTLFTIGALWQSFSGLLGNSDFAWKSIILGRFVGGFGMGFILLVAPVYSSELSPLQYRGQAVTLFQLNVTLGIFLMAIVNEFIQDMPDGWRVAIAVQAIPVLVILVLVLGVPLPESPKYLMRRGREKEAVEALVRHSTGSPNQDEVVSYEVKEMRDEVAQIEELGEGNIFELFQAENIACTVCACMVAFSQNLTGVNWFMNYASILFQSLGFPAFTFDLILKGLNVLFTVLTLPIVDRFGRKFLTVYGTLGVILVFFISAVVLDATGVDITSSNSDHLTKTIQLFFVVMVFIFQSIFACFWAPASWIVPAEVFPVRLRGAGMSAAVVSNMITQITMGDFGFVNLSKAVGIANTCWVLVALNMTIVLGTVVFLQPETKGFSLEGMRQVFNYSPTRQVTDIENNIKCSNEKGTMVQFYKRNAKQTENILKCKSSQPAKFTLQ